jgi:hypothetical protein
MFRAFPTLILRRCLVAALFSALPLPAEEPPGTTLALEQRLPRPNPPQGHDRFDVPEAVAARLRERLPALWKRLSQREGARLLVLTEPQMLEMWQEPDEQTAPNFVEAFAKDLANRFSLPGGVRSPGMGGLDSLSPAVTLRVLAQEGQTVVDAVAILRSVAKQAPVDAVILCHGMSEARAGMTAAEFSRHLQQAGDAARELGADVIAVAPWTPHSARPEVSLGMTRPLADVLLETAKDEGWMGLDLGDWLGWFELPPHDAVDEAQRFARLADGWRGFFHELTDGRYVPRASLHQRLAAILLARLLEGPVEPPLVISNARAMWKSGETPSLEVSCQVENRGKESAQFTLLPLIAGGWRPQAVQPEISLAAGAKEERRISYASAPDAEAGAQVWLPLLLFAGRQVWLHTLRAPVLPVAVVWEPEATFNLEGKLDAGGQIINQSSEDILGTWEMEFNGASQRGDVRLKPGAGMPLEGSFELPAPESAAQTLPLKLTLRVGSLTIKRTRQCVLARNFGLKQGVPLLPASPGQAGKVMLSAEADRNQITFILEAAGRSLLLPAGEGMPTWQIEAWLDARSYGSRLEEGSTWPLRAQGSATGKGRGTVSGVMPWAFGTGYAAVFDPSQFQASLLPLDRDRFQLHLTVPRTYLYLHEWALENGNSQLGMNLRLTLNTESGPQSWSLMPIAPLPNRVSSLRVLELASKPTARLTLQRR